MRPANSSQLRLTSCSSVIFPYIIFLIFAAQEEVCEVWLSWCYNIIGLCKRHRTAASDLGLSIARRPSRVSDYLYGPCRHIAGNHDEEDSDSMHHGALNQFYAAPKASIWDGQGPKGLNVSPDLPRHIAPYQVHDPSSAYSARDTRSPTSAFGGLSPPPHAARNKHKNLRSVTRTSLSRAMPSLTAFGSRSEEDEQHMSQTTDESRGDASVHEPNSSQSVVSRFYARPATAHSSKTFGSS